MIEPNEADVGRQVVYTRREQKRDGTEDLEFIEGVVTSFNDHYVFVRYRGDTGSKGTRRDDLGWSHPAHD